LFYTRCVSKSGMICFQVENYSSSSLKWVLSLTYLKWPWPVWYPGTRDLSLFPWDYLDLICNYKGGIKPNSKLSDNILLNWLPSFLEIFNELFGAASSNSPQIVDHFFPCHAYTIILNNKLAFFRIDLDLNDKSFWWLIRESLLL
jgi:hypothetical protein